MPYVLPPLAYAFDALEPHIDARTMQVHHNLHHQADVDHLNAALAGEPQLADLSIEDLLRRLDQVPAHLRTAVRNNGGGHANHQLFWKIMAPGGRGAPSGALAEAINRDFGSYEAFQTAFEEAGARLFGSGWVFLIVRPDTGRLEVVTRPNQDSVLLDHLPALLGNDVWEHAYYLKHQNRRPAYLNAWWSVVNWSVVAERLDGVRAGKAQL